MASRHIGSVYIRVVPDTKDFRRDTQRAFDRMEPFKVPVEVEIDTADMQRRYDRAMRELERRSKPVDIDVTPNTDGFEEELDEGVEKATSRKDFTVKVSADYDGVIDALDTMQRELEALERTREIKFNLDRDSIQDAMRRLEDELATGKDELGNALTAQMRIRPDEQGYRQVIRQIEEIRRMQQRPIEMEIQLDEDGLQEQWDEAHRELARLQNQRPLLTEKVMIEYDATSRESMDAQIAELEKRLRGLQSDKVTIPVDMDQSSIEAALAELQSRRRNVNLHPRVNPFALGMVEGQLATAARDRWVNLRPRIARSFFRDIEGAFMAIAGLNSIRTLVNQIRDIALNFDEWAFSVGTVSAAIGSLASVATVGLGAVLSIAADTLQVFQGLAMAPAFMLSGATALQTWTAVWQDFEAALQGIPGVLEEMPPAAQRAVGAVEDLNAAVNQTVQQNFWGQMTDEVDRFREAIGPYIVEAMGNTATVMGRTISNMLDHTERLAEGGSLDTFIEHNTEAMELLGDAAETAFRTLMDMGIHGSRYLPKLAGWAGELADNFEAFMSDAIESGKFDQWIANSVNSLRSLGQTMKATWNIFAGFNRAFKDVGGPGLHEMADGLERVSDWVNSSGTQQALREMFEAAMEGASAAGRGISDLVSTLWDYRDAVNEALVVTGRLAGEFLTAVSRIDPTVLFRGFFDMMDGLRDFVRIGQPGFESIANIFGRLGSIGGEVAREVAHGMNLTMAAIDGFIARIEGPLIDAIHPLTRVFEDIAALGTPALFAMADSLAVVLNLFNALPGPIQNIITLLTVLGRTGILAGFQKGMQNLTRGTRTAQQSVFRFTSDVENRTARMRDRVAANMAAVGTSINRAFTGIAAAGSVNVFASQVETRLAQMRTRVGTIMSRVGASIRRGFGGLVGALGGPWGIAITAAIGALSAFVGASAEAEAAQERLKASVNETTGAIENQAVIEAYDQLRDNTQSWLDEFWNGARDMDAIFDTMGTSAEELARGLQGPAKEVREMADASRELANLDVSQFNLLKEGNFDGVSDGARSLFENMNGAELSAQDFFSAMQLIANIYGPIADRSDYVKERMAELGVEAEETASKFDGIDDGLKPATDAMKAFSDETASAASRIDGLHRSMQIMAGVDLSREELAIHAVESFDQAMRQIEQLAADSSFDASRAFNENLEFDISQGIEAVKIQQAVDLLGESFAAEVAGLEYDLANDLIDQDEFNASLGDIEERFAAAVRQFGEDLGLGEQEVDAFVDHFTDRMSFDPVEIEIQLEHEEQVAKAEEDFARLDALGLGWQESKYTATLDADGDGFVSEQERVEAAAKAFDELVATGKIDANADDFDETLDAALESGLYFNGTSFKPIFDADGEPFKVALAALEEQGYAFDGEEFVAVADVETDAATDALTETINQAQGLWHDGEFIAKLDADGEPTEEMLAYAQSLGLEWHNGEFVSVVDADGEGADREIAARREQALEYQTTYEALLDAGLLPSAAGAFVDAIASAEEYEGDYQAVLDALQSEEGKRELIEFVEGLEGIPERTKSEIIAAIEGDELVDDLQTALNELDETNANPTVDVDTSDAEDKVEGVSNDLREYSTIEPSTKVDADTEDAEEKIDGVSNDLREYSTIEPTATVDADTDSADEKIGNTSTAAQRLGLINPMVSLGIMGDNHVINRANDAKDAADQVDDSFLSTLLSTGSGGVVAAAMAAFGADSLVDDSFLSTLLSTGSGGVIAAAMGAFGASDMVDDFFQAIFGETGASHVMGQAGGVQGSISSINMNPVVKFGGAILGSFTRAVSNVRNTISNIASGIAGVLSREGSMTGTRFKPEVMPLLDVRAFAGGGFENHAAQIAYSTPSTPIRIWAEPETGGEAYIPLSPAKRRRSMGIFEEVGKQFGVFGDGGIEGGVVTRTERDRGGDVYYITVSGDNLSPKDIVSEMTHQQRRRARR